MTDELTWTQQVAGVLERPRRGPKPKFGVSMNGAERMRRSRTGSKEEKLRCIAVLDMETDPFDNVTQDPVYPFAAELYSDQFGSIVIWELDFEKFITKLLAAIEGLPGSFIIYAHNGGKFDYMFLVARLRGLVKFKGRSIMSTKIGRHELRDSLHILPEKLAAWKKDNFDYTKLLRKNRNTYKTDILDYLHSDCIYLFDIVKTFVNQFGLKISIGAAAFTELKKHHKIEGVKESMDTALRPYNFGGRVECVAGRGIFGDAPGRPPFKLYDVNAMYLGVMCNMKHPISAEYNWHRGTPTDNTVFLDISCRNRGALMRKKIVGEFIDEDAEQQIGRFKTTIHEFKVALKYGLISDVTIHWCIDNAEMTDFSSFGVPLYAREQEIGRSMVELRAAGKETSREFEELHKQKLFAKYLRNNAYGKCSQDPRKYKDYYYTELNEKPDKEWFDFLAGADEKTVHEYSFPIERVEGGSSPGFAVWHRPNPGHRFNNVGTGASITGAARSVLLEALVNSDDPIYCDTDSIMCRQLNGCEIDDTKLGAWKVEQTFDEIIIAGKKTYACKVHGLPDGHDKRIKIRTKGTAGVSYDQMARTLGGEVIPIVQKAPTFTKTGHQHYMTRCIRATADFTVSPLRSKRI